MGFKKIQSSNKKLLKSVCTYLSFALILAFEVIECNYSMCINSILKIIFAFALFGCGGIITNPYIICLTRRLKFASS